MTEKDLIIQDLRRENAKLRARVPEWISVDDRLPEEAVDIIVYTTKKRIAFGYLYDGHFRDEEHEIMASWNIGEVTHWMHMPEPPKGE